MIRACTAILSLLLASCATVPAKDSASPINDPQAAVSRARALLARWDGNSSSKAPELLTAIREGDIWTVKAPDHCGPNDTFLMACQGNTVKLSAKDGTVLYILHN
jgi:hypothetical protein